MVVYINIIYISFNFVNFLKSGERSPLIDVFDKLL